MADRLLLESSTVDGYLLEDGTGVLLVESTSYSTTILATAGLVSYWRLGESSGTTAADSKGTNTGTYVGSPTQGVPGALSGDSDTAITTAAGKYVSVVDSATLDWGNGPFSVEFWFKRADALSGYQLIWAKGTAGNVFLNVNKLSLDNDSSTIIQASGTTTDTIWHHGVITRSGTGTGNNKVYIDGADVTANAAGINNTTATNATNPRIGVYTDNTFGPFIGSLDEVAVYNVDLSAATVLAHYNAGAGGGNQTVTPAVAALVTAAFAPTVSATANQTVTPATATLALAAFTPTLKLSVIPGVASLALTTFAPSVAVTNHQTVTPGVATLSTATFVPTVTAAAHQTVTPAPATLTTAAFIPTVTTSNHQLVTPSVASLTTSAFAPTIARTFVPSTASLSLTTFAPTFSVTNVPTIYGTLGADGKGNIQVGQTGQTAMRFAYRFKARYSDDLTTLRWQQRGGVGYSSQDGLSVVMRISVCADNAGVPGTVLDTQDFTVTNPTGTWATYVAHTFTSPATLVAGTRYFIVFEDVSAGTQWISVNNLVTLIPLSPMQPGWADSDWALHEATTGSNWVFQSAYTPHAEMGFAGGQFQGMGYQQVFTDFEAEVSGTTSMARELFTVSGGNKITTGSSVRVRRTTGTGLLTIGLYTDAGTLVESQTFDASAFPLSTSATAGDARWATVTWSTARTLTNGSQYYLRISCAAGSTYRAPPLRDGIAVGFTAASHFTDGAATMTTDSGGTWVQPYAFDTSDLQFYFNLESNNQTVTPGVAALILAAFAPVVTASYHQLITPGVASLTTSAFVPVIRLAVIPGTAALSTAIFAPTVTTTANAVVIPATASLSTSAFAPTVAATAHQVATPATATLTVSRFAPTATVSNHQLVTPTVATLTTASFAPTVSASNHQLVTAGVAALTTSAFAPVIRLAVIPATAALSTSTFAPSVAVTNHQTVTPATATLTVSRFAPTATVSNHQLVTPGVASLTTTGLAPTVTAAAHRVATPATASLTTTAFVPAVTATAHQIVVPATATVAITTLAPTATASNHQTVTPGVTALATTALAPTVTATANRVATPATAAVTLTTFAPTALATAHQLATPPTAALTTTTFVPTVTAAAGLTLVPDKASLALTAFAPTVSATAHQTVTPGVSALAATRFAPTVTASDHKTVIPGVAALTTARFAPTVTASDHKTATPSVASLTLTTFAPTIATTGHQFVTPVTAALGLTTFAPSAVAPVRVVPQPASLTLVTFIPSTTVMTAFIVGGIPPDGYAASLTAYGSATHHAPSGSASSLNPE